MSMPEQPTLAVYLARLCALEEEAVAGSKAFPGTTMTTGEPVYWTNHLAGFTSKFQDPNMSSHTISIQAILVRDPLTAGLDLENEARCQEDALKVADYFLQHPDFTGSASELRAAIRGYVPRSLTVQGLGVVDVPRGEVTFLGSRYLITFAINRYHTPLNP